MTNNFSFSKNSANDQLEIALRAFQLFESEPVNVDFADKYSEEINKCLDYIHREKLCKCHFSKIRDCSSEIFNKCIDLAVIRDVADSSKHNGIDRPYYVVKSAQKYNGGFNSGFSRGFDVSKLVIVIQHNDNELFFIDIAKNALKYLERIVRP